MDALDDHHTVPHLHGDNAVAAALAAEIEIRDLCAARADELQQAAVDGRDIQCVHALIIHASVGQTGIILQVLVKIVQRHHRAAPPMGGNAVRQLVGGGCFAGGRRPGEHHHMRAALPHARSRVLDTRGIVLLAVINERLGRAGRHVHKAQFNEPFRNPDQRIWHKSRQLPACALAPHQSARCIPTDIYG